MQQTDFDAALRARHGDQAQDLLYQSRVAIAGAGGVGSQIAYLLTRAGVGHIQLIDFDCVELNNLHRQQYRIADIGKPKVDALKEQLEQINPFSEIITYHERVDETNMRRLFSEADIIIEAFDQPEEKAKLVNFCLEHFPKKKMIANSGMAGYGWSNRIHTRKCMKNFYICGDECADVAQEGTLFAARVAICAGHAANLAIRLIIDPKNTEHESDWEE